jgi:hypothetical protein
LTTIWRLFVLASDNVGVVTMAASAQDTNTKLPHSPRHFPNSPLSNRQVVQVDLATPRSKWSRSLGNPPSRDPHSSITPPSALTAIGHWVFEEKTDFIVGQLGQFWPRHT